MPVKMSGHFQKGNEMTKMEFVGRSARVGVSRVHLRGSKMCQGAETETQM